MATSEGKKTPIHLSESSNSERNSNIDDAILNAQGHQPELQRSLSWFGVLGLGYSVALSWAGFLTGVLAVVSSYGGGQTLVFAFLIGAAGQWIVFLGLAEMCSAFPSAGGQYHFTYILSPRNLKNIAAFTVGLTNIVAWCISTASGIIYLAISVSGMIEFWVPGFKNKTWQTYLLYDAFILITLIPIFTIPQSQYNKLTQTSLTIAILGFIPIIVVPLALGKSEYTPSNLTTYTGASGWPPGVAWLLSLSTSGYSFAAIGSVVHMAEELPRPGRNIPIVINLSMTLGVLTAVPVSIILVGAIKDMERVQKAFLPSLEAFYQITGSRLAATLLHIDMNLVMIVCYPSVWVTCGRTAWSFARDNGLPFSGYWSHVSTRFKIPVRATFLTAGFCVVYGLVYIASTQAFNSIVNTSVLLLNIAYTAPQVMVLFGRRDRLPRRPFALGAFGYAVNCFSVVWTAVTMVMLLFPGTYPTTLGSMNYGSVVVVGIFVVIMLLWLERRGKFSGPQIDWEMLNQKAK